MMNNDAASKLNVAAQSAPGAAEVSSGDKRYDRNLVRFLRDSARYLAGGRALDHAQSHLRRATWSKSN